MLSHNSPRRPHHLFWILLLLMNLLFIDLPDASAQPSFGVNYWPMNFGANVLLTTNWNQNSLTVQKDLDHLASLGSRVVRLGFAPDLTGYTLSQTPGGGGILNLGIQQQIAANLPALLAMLKARNMKVIIAFHNEYMRLGTWQPAYSSFGNFVNDSKSWTQGIVNAANASASASSVLYYDFCNESADDQPNTWTYINTLYDANFVPVGKRGVSVLQVPRDSDKLKTQLGGRLLQFVDFHSYPADGLNANIESSYDQVKVSFPSATVLLGEFGRSGKYCVNAGNYPGGKNYIACVATSECTSAAYPGGTCAGTDEITQSATNLDLINRSINKGIPYYLHWTLWDGVYPSSAFGLGYSPHVPKDALGAVSARLSVASNSDMELQSGSTPTGWFAGGTVPVTFSSGFGQTAAATGSWYARARVDNQAAGTVWIVSPTASVGGKTMLDVNFYVRSTMAQVHAEIHEYNSSGVATRLTVAPSFTPSGWSMNSYHHALQTTWRLALQSTTVSVRFAAVASVNAANPDYLDIDTVSLYAR